MVNANFVNGMVLAPKHVEVVAGLIFRDGRLLACQRRESGAFPLKWEFPGGKVEPGESFEECLIREIAEELDIQVAVGQQFGVVKHSFTHFKMRMVVFMCSFVSGTPKAIGCDTFAWVTRDELESYAFPVSDRNVITALRRGDYKMTFIEE